MNKVMCMSILLTLVLVSNSAVAKRLNEYKCYALLVDDSFAVIDVETKQKSLAQASKNAIAEGHKLPGMKRQQVAQIMQCVGRSEDFSDANARLLDENKLR